MSHTVRPSLFPTFTVVLLLVAGCNPPPPPPAASPTSTAEAPRRAPVAAADYVGSEVCAECHADQHASYLHTAHSKSLSLVDPEAEPPDATFLHERSGRTYSVYRAGGELRQREFLSSVPVGQIANPSAALPETAADNPAATNAPSPHDESFIGSDYPVTYLVGSGRHSRTYLSEIDGFLVEAPITWYESRRAWDLSPGYDARHPPGFERAADVGCLACHVGGVEAIEGSLHRLRIHELSIGCERCHGPGRQHVAAARSEAAREVLASSITNPSELSRALAEDICAQCHLRGDATVFLPGKGPMDFVPGMPLTSIRVDLVLDADSERMQVVGHVEQMRRSRCYTQSGELTCMTCHELHSSREVKSSDHYYRSKCMECHTLDACGLPHTDARRVARSDLCHSCHMPQAATDIPHIAFTHHRIGLHQAEVRLRSSDGHRLVPCHDVSEFEPEALLRVEGLAYLELASRQTNAQQFARFHREAFRRLELVHRRRPDDGEVSAAIAQLCVHTDPIRSAALASRALTDPSLRVQSRINALVVVGITADRSGQSDKAQAAFGQLFGIRRFAGDSILLAGSLRQANAQAAVAQLRRAAQVQPFRAELAMEIAVLLEATGQMAEANQWRERAKFLVDGENSTAEQ